MHNRADENRLCRGGGGNNTILILIIIIIIVINHLRPIEHPTTNSYWIYYSKTKTTKYIGNREVITGTTIASNRFDIILVNKGTKEVHIIDNAICNSPNIMKKYNEKINK
jgi:hypothetical protein